MEEEQEFSFKENTSISSLRSKKITCFLFAMLSQTLYQARLTIIHLLRASSGCSMLHDRADIQ